MSLSRNVGVCVALVIVFMHAFADLSAQCEQRITLTRAVVDENGAYGKVDIKVEANGHFKGELIIIDGTDESTVQNFTGTGTTSLSFSRLTLDREIFYRIVIEFEGEEKFLCKRKVKDIVITDTK